ncbi:ubiquinone biosynthesis monooxygenase Coq7 [Cladochytrium tenue]|nr:ubiquinone biosynthesis monooxygenase Coq7 [Cladochytrium tenue]
MLLRPLHSAVRGPTAVAARRMLGSSTTAAVAAETASGVAQPQPQTQTPAQLSASQRRAVEAMIRVDQAGELGADVIYRGQLAVLGRHSTAGPIIQHMWEQERLHLDVMNQLVGANRVRPSALTPFWGAAGYALGVATALLGREAAMACTEAVEDVINEHYNDQIRELLTIEGNEEIQKLQGVIAEFRDDEIGHMNTAIENDSRQSPAYGPLTAAIRQTCRTAIWIASRV